MYKTTNTSSTNRLDHGRRLHVRGRCSQSDLVHRSRSSHTAQVAPAQPPKLEEPVVEKKPEEAAQEVCSVHACWLVLAWGFWALP